jgi:hypothetical protein
MLARDVHTDSPLCSQTPTAPPRYAHAHDSVPIVELGVDEQDKVGTSQLALCQCIACCPLTMVCSWVPIATRTELVVLNYGSYTGTYKAPGCTFINCWGREMHVISTAAQSIDLAVTKILDKNGNPLLVSAIIVYHIVNTKRAALDVKDSAQFVRLQAMAVLKRIVSQYVAASITMQLSMHQFQFDALFVNSVRPVCEQCVPVRGYTSICSSFSFKHCSNNVCQCVAASVRHIQV